MVLQDLTCAAGVDYDVRITALHHGIYDRFCVRNAEVWQSISIIRQALEKCLREMNFMLTFLTTYLRKKMCTPVWSL
jgi:NADH-quinone oxidoreductase subunit D